MQPPLLQNFLYGFAADCSNFLGGSQRLKTCESRSYDVAGVVGAERLCTDVLDADSLNDRTHGTARDNAGTGSSGLHEHSARAELTDDFVRNGCASEGNLHQVLLGVLDTLADCVGNLARLADAEAYGAVAVADNK